MNPGTGIPLDDPIHEKACLLRASGETQDAAYDEAFGRAEGSGANNSSRFFRQPHIKARVADIKRWRSAMANLDEAWILTQLKAVAKNAKLIGDANLDDYFAKNAEGQRLGISLLDVSRAKMAALDEVTVEEYVEGKGEDAERIRRTKIKLRNAQSSGSMAALELLGKHLGMWPNKTALTNPAGDGPAEIVVYSDADRVRALNALAARALAEQPK